ncbi:MAG: Holliday junction branch migration protein RuvA [Hyphomicrobiales bacterium]
MIGKLTGKIDSYGDDWVIIDVGGVGYHVTCSTKTLQSLPQPGEAASVAIETYVREDQIRLFGFANDVERDWFRLLLSVQGVGTKVALAVLSTLSIAELANAVALQDKAMIARAPGIGPKVALRVVNELKGKVPALATGVSGGGETLAEALAAPGGTAVTDAISALTNLGYNSMDASAAVAKAAKGAGDDAGAETLIRLALKELAR